MSRLTRCIALALTSLASLASFVMAQPNAGAVPTPGPDGIDVFVPIAPALARVAGADRLTYELHVTNLGTAAATLERLEVLGPARGDTVGVVLATYDGPALAAMLGRPGLGPTAQHDPAAGAGLRAVLYLDMPISGAALPTRLAHRLTFSRPAPAGVGGPTSTAPTRFTVDVGAVGVDRTEPPTFGPPLRGGPWAAVYDPTMDRGHRRVLYAVGGRARVPGRFAIDWFRVDDRGQTGAVSRADTGGGTSAQAAAGGPDRLGEFFGYGAEVLAVADGIVAGARDGVAEPERASAAPRVTAAQAAGNYVALQIGGGRYAVYEHLQPGLRVRVGQRVRRGEVIGRVGLSGQASAPHLHLHVADAPEPLGGEGRPYRFGGYTVLGRYPDIAAFGRAERWAAVPTPAREAGSLPGPNAVVMFDGARPARGAATPEH